MFDRDYLGLATECAGLLQLVMKQGNRLQPDDDLATIRQRADLNVTSLPADIRDIDYDQSAPVHLSPALAQLTKSLVDQG
jgi:hypothetical protein